MASRLDAFPGWTWPDDITEAEKRAFSRCASRGDRDDQAMAAWNRVAIHNSGDGGAGVGGKKAETAEQVKAWRDVYEMAVEPEDEAPAAKTAPAQPVVPATAPQPVRQRTAEDDARDAAATWVPDDTAIAQVVETNQANVKQTADESDVPIVAGGVLVLIGGGHDAKCVSYVNRQGDLEQGTLWVNKGGVFSAGSIEVEGISGKQSRVESAIEEFSGKKVSFI